MEAEVAIVVSDISAPRAALFGPLFRFELQTRQTTIKINSITPTLMPRPKAIIT